MSIKFGSFVPQGWRMDLAEIDDPVEQYDAMTRVAKAAASATWQNRRPPPGRKRRRSSSLPHTMSEPQGDELPLEGFVISRQGLAIESASLPEIVIDPLSERLQRLEPFPVWIKRLLLNMWSASPPPKSGM